MLTDWLGTSWKVSLVRGIIAIVFGILAVVWPISTTVTLVWVWGVWALAEGLTSIVHAFRTGTTWSRVGWGLMGLIALAAAFFAIFRPISTAVTLTWILGIWLLVRAVFDVVLAFSGTRSTPRWLLLATAAVDVVLGVLFIANPGRSALTVTVLLGCFAIIWGIVAIGTAVTTRSWVNRVTEARADASA